MIELVFAVVVAVLAALVVIDEFRGDGIFAKPADFDAVVFEFPLAEGWSEDDVLVTLAEIEAL